MPASVTKLDDWKASHSRPVVIDNCRWNDAVESIARANMDMWLTTTFIWPRILLRTFTGI